MISEDHRIKFRQAFQILHKYVISSMWYHCRKFSRQRSYLKKTFFISETTGDKYIVGTRRYMTPELLSDTFGHNDFNNFKCAGEIQNLP